MINSMIISLKIYFLYACVSCRHTKILSGLDLVSFSHRPCVALYVSPSTNPCLSLYLKLKFRVLKEPSVSS